MVDISLVYISCETQPARNILIHEWPKIFQYSGVRLQNRILPNLKKRCRIDQLLKNRNRILTGYLNSLNKNKTLSKVFCV